MKKLIVMMVMMFTTSVMIQANAAEMHAFYNPATLARAQAGQLSDAEQREAFRALFSRTNESRWWNNISTCSYDQMRAIYSKHLMEVYNLPEMPSDEAMLALVDKSELIPAPSTVNTAGIVVGTASVKRFSRPAYPNEKMFMQGGIAWASGGCGNLGGNVLDTPEPLPVKEKFDHVPDARPPVYRICVGCPDGRPNIDVNQNQNVRTTGIDPAILALLMDKKSNSNDDWMKQYMQMQMMKEMMNPRQQTAEVVTKNRANAWDVIAGVTGIANMGLNIWDLARESKSQNYYNHQYTTQQYQLPTYTPPVWNGNPPVYDNPRPPSYQWPRPQQPNRPDWSRPQQPRQPDYNTGTWYDRRNPPRRDPDNQGASGDYRLNSGGGYQTANAGLGVGQGGYGYNNGYQDRRSNPLDDDGRGNARDTSTGRDYTYNPNYVW